MKPFDGLPSNVPLDELNPEVKKISDRRLRRNAQVSERLPLNQPDQCPEDTLNRILRAAMKGPEAPYPSWAVKFVADDD